MPSRRWTSGGSGYDGLFGDSFFSDCWDIVDRPGSAGSNRRKQIVKEDITSEVREDRVKPWFRKTNLGRISDDDIYQVMLEVSNFTASELSVTLLNDKTVVVEGKHGERKDVDGVVSREFTRKYTLPESVLPSSVECYLSKDGVLVIRGHAPRSSSTFSRPYSPFGKGLGEEVRSQNTLGINQNSNTIPVFTNGNNSPHSSGSSSILHHKERIIPISHENVHNKVNATPAKNGATDEHLFSGRSSRNSERDYMSPTPSPLPNGRRSRTVSFEDDDTIASNSPIIEEPASTSSQGPTPEPHASTSKRSPPPLLRQNNVDDSIREVRSSSRNSSRMSEERFERSHTPNGLSPTPFIKKTSPNDTIHIDLDDKFDKYHDRDIKSPSDNFDKLHKEIIERHRHLSRESLDRMHLDSDKFLQTARSRSPRLDIRSNNDDIFDSVFKRPLSSGRWDSSIPPKSNEEQYEKKFEKGYDKNGNYTETMEERMMSQQFSSYKSDNFKPKGLYQERQKALEHPINISSAA